jgi:hypothetical protein
LRMPAGPGPRGGAGGPWTSGRAVSRGGAVMYAVWGGGGLCGGRGGPPAGL